tara:strand:+ start:9572 stop:9811 length:240 start_codon:yes stop_codon:yes gene_type:complete
MDADEFRELQELVKRQFELALAGERPVYCCVCRRPFRCIEITAPTSVFRVVFPFRHAIAGTRALCNGSEMQALLTPRQP